MKFTLTFFFIYLTTILFSQTEFNEYITIQSQGPIPLDFSIQTKNKLENDIKVDREELSRSQKNKFLEMIHYGIDDILHSGLCVYGDPISNYTSKIAKHLLQDDQDLYSKLRFYTIKSNVPNAFSTDQGIVFITTGLIAKLASEAELAYIISHEISHYTEKHVVQTFDWNLKNNNHHDYVKEMSTYSKEREIEADKIAVELCYKAGYSSEEIYNTFDVLLHSYLPFEEVVLPKTYFNTLYFYVPQSSFSKLTYDIKDDQNVDDTYSTHPNCKKRKENVSLVIDAFNNWGTKKYIFKESDFLNIRTIARFESVRTDVLNGNFSTALYTIFLLEQYFPNSIYLDKMKAHAWLGLVSFKFNNNFDSAVIPMSDFEGESASMHYFIMMLDRSEVVTMSLRQLYDIQAKYPNDDELKIMFTKIIQKAASSESFSLSEYSNLKYHEAVEEYQERYLMDSTINEVDFKTNYYLYGISDIIADSIFTTQYHEFQLKTLKEKEFTESLTYLPYSEQSEILEENKKNASKLSINNVVVVEPTVISYTKKGINNTKSDELEQKLANAIEFSSNEADVNIYRIDKRTLDINGTDAFNEKSVISTLLQQIVLSKDYQSGVAPVDFALLQNVKHHYGTSNILFTLVENYQTSKVKLSTFGMIFYFPPALPLYLFRDLFLSNQTKLTYILLDLESGSIKLANTHHLNSPVKKWYLRSQMFDLFDLIHNKPHK